LANVPVGTAFATLINKVNPEAPQGMAVVGAVPSSVDGPPTLPAEEPAISISLAEPSVLDALNAIVLKAPGTVWILTRIERNNNTSYRLSYLSPGGRLTALSYELK
jgi:hypothetical protein